VVGGDVEGHGETKNAHKEMGKAKARQAVFNRTASSCMKRREEVRDDDHKGASCHGPFVVEEREALLA
jgi:hypothetical protein